VAGGQPQTTTSSQARRGATPLNLRTVSSNPAAAGSIGIVTPQYAPSRGGVERYVERLAVGLARRGIAVEVITPDRPHGSTLIEVREGVVVHRLPLLGFSGAGGCSDLASWLLANAERFSVLNAHNLHTVLPVMTCLIAERKDVPFVLTAHWHGAGRTSGRQLMHIPYRPIAMWTARSADAVIYNSRSERSLLEHQLGVRRRLAFIPEGADVALAPRLRKRPQEDPDGVSDKQTILAVGRLEPYKGTESVVRALPHLPSEYRLVIIGIGSARDAIEVTAQRVGVAGRVLFRDSCPDEELHQWYARAAVCVSLSAQESFGLVALESAAAGAPVVVSDIPAHRDLSAFVAAGRLFFVDRTAPPQAIAAAIQDAARAGRLASSRRSGADGWRIPTWDGLVDETLRVFSSVRARSS
jgi:glycosyltransferase involved in cell wall biosynthesis